MHRNPKKQRMQPHVEEDGGKIMIVDAAIIAWSFEPGFRRLMKELLPGWAASLLNSSGVSCVNSYRFEGRFFSGGAE